MEELKIVYIDSKNKEKIFLIGSLLSDNEEKDLIDLLRDNIDVLAWSPHEMPEIDPNVITHNLNANPGFKPIRQKRGGSHTNTSRPLQKRLTSSLGQAL